MLSSLSLIITGLPLQFLGGVHEVSHTSIYDVFRPFVGLLMEFWFAFVNKCWVSILSQEFGIVNIELKI